MKGMQNSYVAVHTHIETLVASVSLLLTDQISTNGYKNIKLFSNLVGLAYFSCLVTF